MYTDYEYIKTNINSAEPCWLDHNAETWEYLDLIAIDERRRLLQKEGLPDTTLGAEHSALLGLINGLHLNQSLINSRMSNLILDLLKGCSCNRSDIINYLYWGDVSDDYFFSLADEDSIETALSFLNDNLANHLKPQHQMRYCEACDQEFCAEYKTIDDYWKHIRIIFCATCKTNLPKTEGYVYLLQSMTDPIHYKIGRTSSPDNRIKTFGIQLPFKVEYIALIKAYNMYALETALHEKFSDKRIDGEWFALNPDNIAYIKNLAEKVHA